MKKTKVVFCLCDMRIGGVETVFIRTLESLLKCKDLEISLVTYAKIKEPLYVEWFKKHPQVKITTLYPCRWLGTNLVHFFLFRLIQHVLRDIYRWFKRTFVNKNVFNDADVLIDYYNFSFDKEFRKINKPKLVWWHSSIDVFINGNYISYMKDYDMLVSLTDGFTEEFKSRWPQYSDKIIRIYNPIDVEEIKQKAEKATSPKNEKYFVCVSRLYADKDIDTLIEAFNEFWLENKKPNVKLYIIGEGSCAGRYKELAKSLPVKSNVIFTGALANPFGYMKGALASVLSSRAEGFGMVVIEAAALGVLNISSDCRNGPREILLDGKAGLLFEPGNKEELKKHFDSVWNKKVDIKKMEKEAFDSLDRFDAENITKQILKLIKSYK